MNCWKDFSNFIHKYCFCCLNPKPRTTIPNVAHIRTVRPRSSNYFEQRPDRYQSDLDDDHPIILTSM